VWHEADDAHPRDCTHRARKLVSTVMTPLPDSEVEQRLAGQPEWRRAEGPSIERDLKFADFAAAIAFVDRVAAAAEDAGHHPDILVHGWNNVRLTLSTHSAGGLTAADFELAAQIDSLL
jgi:4a-hydroxytetrahydrobiopterin dehydratase